MLLMVMHYGFLLITDAFIFYKKIFIPHICYKYVTKKLFNFFFLILGSSSFESQKMERPSISVISPTSPGALKDAPQVLPGQLSVCTFVHVGDL